MCCMIGTLSLAPWEERINKSTQSNLGRGPRRGTIAHVCRKVRRAPNAPPKVPLPVDRSLNPTTCLIPGPVRPMMPNGIRIRSAVFPQRTGQPDSRTDACTDRPTDCPRESLITKGRCATRATRPNNYWAKCSHAIFTLRWVGRVSSDQHVCVTRS